MMLRVAGKPPLFLGGDGSEHLHAVGAAGFHLEGSAAPS